MVTKLIEQHLSNSLIKKSLSPKLPLVDLGFSEPCGPDFVSILSFSLFIVGPSAKYLPGGNADGLLSFRAFFLS